MELLFLFFFSSFSRAQKSQLELPLFKYVFCYRLCPVLSSLHSFPLHLLLSHSPSVLLRATYMTILRLIDCNIFEKREESTFHGSEQCRGCSRPSSTKSLPLDRFLGSLSPAPQRVDEQSRAKTNIFSRPEEAKGSLCVCVCVYGSRSCKLRFRAILNVNVTLEVEVQHCLLEYRPAIN